MIQLNINIYYYLYTICLYRSDLRDGCMFWREKELLQQRDKKCIFLTKLEKDLPQHCHSTQIIFLDE